MSQGQTVDHPVLKAASAWVAAWLADLNIHSWGDVAAMLAAAYSFLLIIEWVWKRFFRKPRK
jgi:hypothetical protein